MNIDDNNKEQVENVHQLIHDARAPLNRISMQAEFIKLVLENNMPVEQALAAADKIINSCQVCSQALEKIANK